MEPKHRYSSTCLLLPEFSPVQSLAGISQGKWDLQNHTFGEVRTVRACPEEDLLQIVGDGPQTRVRLKNGCQDFRLDWHVSLPDGQQILQGLCLKYNRPVK